MYTDVRCKESTLSNKFVKSALTHPLSTKAIDPHRALPLSTEWQASIGSAATRFTVPNSNSWKETEKDENQWTLGIIDIRVNLYITKVPINQQLLWSTGTFFKPLIPKIWLLILSSCCYTIPCKLVTRIWSKITIKFLISLSILINRLLENKWISKGEGKCLSLLGVKGLKGVFWKDIDWWLALYSDSYLYRECL